MSDEGLVPRSPGPEGVWRLPDGVYRRTRSRARDEYDRQAGTYDRRWAGYIRCSTEPVLRRLALRPGDRLLDVGCGTGALLHQISRRWPGARLHGIDPSHGMLRRAGRRLGDRASLVQGEAGRLPFSSRSFSVVVSTSSLRYWPDVRAGLREVARVLRPGGELLLLDWCGDFLRHRLLARWLELTGRVAGHVHRRAELERLLSACGFSAEVECFRAGWFWRFLLARATLRPA